MGVAAAPAAPLLHTAIGLLLLLERQRPLLLAAEALQLHNAPDPSSRDRREQAWRMGTLDLNALSHVEGKDGRCLNFLHIPKTGGTSLEKTFQVTVSRTNGSDGAGVAAGGDMHNMKGWGMRDSSLTCTEPKTLAWGPGCSVTDAGGRKVACARWHMPPAWDSRLAASYSSSCTTFCVVRDPVKRAISESGFRHVRCNAELVDRWVRSSIQRLQREPEYEDCHFVPQYEYVYGGLALPNGWRPGHPGHYCQRVLHFENLATEFQELMREFDFPLALTEHAMPGNCSGMELRKETVDLIKEVYKEDYESFGF